uniref:BTB domain-containing protein n=1 Tax=Gopherus evgoodei TaxID=1825980 RepID=A0A8C5EXA6_9SAUR
HPPPARELGLGTAGARPEQLNEQRLRGQFCDVTIIAEDTKFPAHKNVLAASSPYFKEVLPGAPRPPGTPRPPPRDPAAPPSRPGRPARSGRQITKPRQPRSSMP